MARFWRTVRADCTETSLTRCRVRPTTYRNWTDARRLLTGNLSIIVRRPIASCGRLTRRRTTDRPEDKRCLAHSVICSRARAARLLTDQCREASIASELGLVPPRDAKSDRRAEVVYCASPRHSLVSSSLCRFNAVSPARLPSSTDSSTKRARNDASRLSFAHHERCERRLGEGVMGGRRA